jgi:formate dehydrogenase major subunit
MALRGHSTIQGATDLSTLYDTLPGYLLQPAAYDRTHEDLSSYIEHEGMQTGYWANFSKFIVSLLKAWYGDAATPDNDFGFSWLPRVDADYSALAYFDRMAKGEVKGYFLTGQNPGGGPNAGLHRAGLRNLDWLVVLDWFETESAVLWKNDPNAPPPFPDQDRGLLHPRGRHSGEGGQLNQHAATAPMAQQGRRSIRRSPFRRLVSLQPG